jgi:hypothetical protein
MGDAGEPLPMSHHPKITSSQHEQGLNVIDEVRKQGVGSYVQLPQLVATGDQSSGITYPL